jgi:hypothetical protein
LPLKITEKVGSKKCGDIISYDFEWAFRYQFFAVEAQCILISHIFQLKRLKRVFCDLKSKFPLNLKIE